ncbi:MAG: hypothetical protein Kow00105_01610 [Phycisphaeraceae bacterium]
MQDVKHAGRAAPTTVGILERAGEGKLLPLIPYLIKPGIHEQGCREQQSVFHGFHSGPCTAYWNSVFRSGPNVEPSFC